jgi:predicted NUDIX family NTP pyrophosphohydrolase
MAKLSAGILLYDASMDGELRVLLVHPGGPFWARRDLGAWSIPKGEYLEGEDPLAAALREFEEETGARPGTAGSPSESTRAPASDAPIPLGTVRQSNGKTVVAWAMAGRFDPATLVSNTSQMEWPKGSGPREFPEVDRAEWFTPGEARLKLVKAQAEFVDRLVERLHADGAEEPGAR